MNAKLTVAVVIALVAVTVAGTTTAEPEPAENVTLLGMLEEWKYPDAEFHGATASDGGVAGVVSTKCQAVLTTTDSFDTVADYYFDHLEVAEADRQRDGTFKSEKAVARSVAVQDDSEGRPVKLRTFIVNDADSSTAIVISRAADERETHIAWSHYRRFLRP